MDRRVEMRAGVLAEADIVPVPGRAALVVARDVLDAERRGLPELGRQRDERKLLRQGLGEIDHPDLAGRNRAREGEQIDGHDTLRIAFEHDLFPKNWYPLFGIML